MIRTHELRVDVYRTTVYLAIGRDDKALEKLVREHHGSECSWRAPTATEDGLTFTSEGHRPVVWLARAPRDPLSIGVFAHEMLHCTASLMRAAGIPLEESSEEAWAYLTQHLTRGFLESVAASRAVRQRRGSPRAPAFGSATACTASA